MNSLQTNESRGAKSIKRMAVKHIKQAVVSDELKQNAQFRGIDISLVEVMGWIISVVDLSNNGKRLVLDDGTGSITGLIWTKTDFSLRRGTFVKAIGSIGRTSQIEKELTLTCTSIVPVVDGNNLPYHLLMRIMDNIKGKKTENDMHMESKALENHPEKAQADMEEHQGSFKRIHQDILKYFSTNQGGSGLPVSTVVTTFISSGAYSKTDINSGIEYLVSAGKLFYCDNSQTILALVE